MCDRRVALGEAEDAPRRVLVADRRVPAADAEVGGGEHHRRTSPGRGRSGRSSGSARPPGRARSARSSPATPGMCRAPCHTVPSSASWSRSVTTTKSHFWRFDADGERQPGLEDAVEIGRRRSAGRCRRARCGGPGWRPMSPRPRRYARTLVAMNGAQAMIRTLVDAGVTTCFTNPGTSEMHFVAALDSVPEMRGVLGLFEGVATGAADGYARMAGVPACTLLHLGPGARQRPRQPAQRPAGEDADGQHRRRPRHVPRPLRRPAGVGHRDRGAQRVAVDRRGPSAPPTSAG